MGELRASLRKKDDEVVLATQATGRRVQELEHLLATQREQTVANAEARCATSMQRVEAEKKKTEEELQDRTAEAGQLRVSLQHAQALPYPCRTNFVGVG